MKRGILIAVMLALVGFGVRTQDNTGNWRLHVPTIAEYIVAAPQIVDQAYREEIESTISTDAPTVVYEELISRYGEPLVFHQKFDLLWDVYRSMAIGDNFQIPADPQTWSLALLRSWLREHPTDFEQTHHIETQAFDIMANGLDFNSDGEIEYLLDYTNDWPGNLLYVIAEVDKTQPEGYRLSLTPLPYVGRFMATRSSPEEGILETLRMEDMNRDGLPEWLVLNRDFGYWESCGKLFVLGWRDGGLVDLAAGGLDYCMGENDYPDWIFTKTNGITEITLQFVAVRDPECPRQIRQQLLWEGSSYRLVDRSLSISLLPQCQEKGIKPRYMYSHLGGVPFMRIDDSTTPLYQQAMRLETENRPDEALKEYVAIYEAAPESAWGRLARLHLEPASSTG